MVAALIFARLHGLKPAGEVWMSSVKEVSGLMRCAELLQQYLPCSCLGVVDGISRATKQVPRQRIYGEQKHCNGYLRK